MHQLEPNTTQTFSQPSENGLEAFKYQAWLQVDYPVLLFLERASEYGLSNIQAADLVSQRVYDVIKAYLNSNNDKISKTTEE